MWTENALVLVKKRSTEHEGNLLKSITKKGTDDTELRENYYPIKRGQTGMYPIGKLNKQNNNRTKL